MISFAYIEQGDHPFVILLNPLRGEKVEPSLVGSSRFQGTRRVHGDTQAPRHIDGIGNVLHRGICIQEEHTQWNGILHDSQFVCTLSLRTYLLFLKVEKIVVLEHEPSPQPSLVVGY